MTTHRSRNGRYRPRGAVTAVALAWLLPLTVACTASQPSAPSASRYTLHVLASSELADMAPILNQAQDATGVKVDLTLTGSLTGAQEVINGTAEHNYDAVWFASDNYLNLYPDGLARLNGTTEIMASPVILGMRSSAAASLRWNHGQVTWAAIAQAAAEHKFTFAMTNPAESNSGLSALVALATAVAGKGAALQASEIPGAEPALTGLFHAQRRPAATTSGKLTEDYLRALWNPSRYTLPDGLIDYESQLLTLQAKAPPGDRITLIYPADGVLEATYPFSLLTSAPAAAKSAYQRLVSYLTSAPVQRQIMLVTHRRPIAGNIPLTPSLAGHQPIELPFPAAPRTVQELIEAYNGKLRAADRIIYVLDISGSMRGARIAALKRALLALTGVDTTLVGKLSAFRTGEEVTFLPFGTTPGTPAVYNLPTTGDQLVLQRMRADINGLHVHGHTAIYDALVDACQIMARQDAADPGRIESIVLLSDGENNTGRDLAEFIAYYQSLPAGSPPVYTIAFGEADLRQLAEVASVTSGAASDAVNQPITALTTVFQEIRPLWREMRAPSIGDTARAGNAARWRSEREDGRTRVGGHKDDLLVVVRDGVYSTVDANPADHLGAAQAQRCGVSALRAGRRHQAATPVSPAGKRPDRLWPSGTPCRSGVRQPNRQ
jgi:Ca-activated chloride channel family protein